MPKYTGRIANDKSNDSINENTSNKSSNNTNDKNTNYKINYSNNYRDSEDGSNIGNGIGNGIAWTTTFDKRITYECIRCGHSCYATSVKINEHDIQRLPKLKSIITNITNNSHSRFPIIQGTENGYCQLLEESTCTVYDSRPAACRFYPFVISEDNRTSGILFVDVTYSCSGIILGKGNETTTSKAINEAVLEYIRQKKKYLNYPKKPSVQDGLSIAEYQSASKSAVAFTDTVVMAISKLDAKSLAEFFIGEQLSKEELADYLFQFFIQWQLTKKLPIRSLDIENGHFFDIYFQEGQIYSKPSDIQLLSVNKSEKPENIIKSITAPIFLIIRKDAVDWLENYAGYAASRYCTISSIEASCRITGEDVQKVFSNYIASSVSKIYFLASVIAQLEEKEAVEIKHVKEAVFALDSSIILPNRVF